MAFPGRAVVDIGATLHAGLVLIGEKLWAVQGPRPPPKGPHPGRAGQEDGDDANVRPQWLNAQAAGGYVTYHADTGRYALTPEQAVRARRRRQPGLPAAARSSSPPPRLKCRSPQITDAFRTGAGFGWHEHDPRRSSRAGASSSGPANNAATSCRRGSPPLTGVEEKLAAGGASGSPTSAAATAPRIDPGSREAFPRSTFIGFDYHGPSIETARKGRRQRRRLRTASRFEPAPAAKSYPRAAATTSCAVRLPARHGRPASGGDARLRIASLRTGRG